MEKSQIGAKIYRAIQDLKDSGINFTHESSDDGKMDSYSHEGKNYTLQVDVNPSRWLGLKFALNRGKDLVHYDVDTDLYNISQAEHESFARGIEEDICVFLYALSKRKILVSESDRLTLLAPTKDGVWEITKGRFLESGTLHHSKEEAMKSRHFQVLVPTKSYSSMNEEVQVLVGSKVNYVRFSYQVDLNFIYGTAHNYKYVNLQIGAPFSLKSRSDSHPVDPEKLDSLTPVIKLLRTKIVDVNLTEDFELSFTFSNGMELQVNPIEKYEAWNMSGEDMGFIVAQGK